MDQRILQIIQKHPELKLEFEELYPELTESEDERIRKAMIECFKARGQGSFAGYPMSTIIIYLEKQKEDYFSFSEEQRKYMEKYISLDKVTLVKLLAERDKNTEEILSFFGNKEQKEQKHSLKLDVDMAFDAREPRDNWEYIKEFCDKFGRIPKDMDELDELISYVMVKKQKERKPIISAEESLGISQEEYNKIVDECIYDEDKEQKPAECIEFDNEFKNQVSHLLVSVLNKEWEYNKGFVEYVAQQLLEYAKHEMKPAEWSEEDDAVFGDLMWCIEQAKKFAKDENDMGNIWFAENWLKKRIKFLRPCQPCEVDDNDKEMEERMIENYMEGRES